MSSPLKQNTTNLQELLETVNNLPAYVDTTGATATASDILSGKTAYADSKKITGNIPTKTASDLTVSGATVTVPAGYYASQATKSVATATQATPSVSVGANGLITATTTQTAGYVSSGTKSATKQLTTQAAKTVTPSTSEQTAIASGVYTTGAIKVAAIPSQYVDNSGVTATEADVLSGKKFGASGSVKTGTMTNNGAISKTMDGINTKSTTIPAGYTTGGTVSLDDTIDNAVNSAITALTEKGVEVPTGTNVTGLAALIAAIESGEGSGGDDEIVTTGNITPAEAVTTLTITHGLGKIPQYFCIFRANYVGNNISCSEKVNTPATAKQNVVAMIVAGGRCITVVPDYSAGYYVSLLLRTKDATYGWYITEIDDQKITFDISEHGTAQFKASKYSWEAKA